MTALRPLYRFLAAPLFLAASAFSSDTFIPYTQETVPESAEALWAEYDPRAQPLETEVIEEWKEDGLVCRYVIFTVCTVKGGKSRVAAFYTFPEGAKNVPAVAWAHGGGQRADRERGAYFARHGFASVDINWGGREIVEGISKNTDWGKVDPSQGPKFYPGALRPSTKLNLEPDEHTIDPVPSPRNGNWFLLATAGRRAITFLEQQPEVDSEKIGITGYSMGGVITSMVAIDPRVKAAVPMVGGTGFILEDFPGIPGSGNSRQYRHPDLFESTIDSQSYWPLVKCPVLFLNASNDFHAIFERVYRCMSLLPHNDWRVSHKLHYNHSLGPEQWVLLKVWFDRYLKGEEIAIAPTPGSRLDFKEGESNATFVVTPAEGTPPLSVDIYYSHDPNPRSRFWKSAASQMKENAHIAELPVRENLPLFAFADLTYSLPVTMEAFQAGETDTYTITSKEEVWLPEVIEIERLRAEARPMPLFEDFAANGTRNWGRAHGGGLKSYLFQDPDLATPEPSARLRWTVQAPRENLSFRIRLEKNRWLTGVKEKDSNLSVARNVRESGEHVFSFQPGDFKNSDDETMSDWENISGFTISVYDGGKKIPLELDSAENLPMLGRMEWINEGD